MDWMYANKKIDTVVTDDQLFNTSYMAYANGVLDNTTSGRYQST